MPRPNGGAFSRAEMQKRLKQVRPFGHRSIERYLDDYALALLESRRRVDDFGRSQHTEHYGR
jgi:hypothetical protein